MKRLVTAVALALAGAACATPDVEVSGGIGGSGPIGPRVGPPPSQPPSRILPGDGPPHEGPIITAAQPPPPLSGGTMLVTSTGHVAVVSDPDHDVVFVVDLDRPRLDFAVALTRGDEPGRSAEDAEGRVHVALRSGGAVATIDPVTGALLERREVCTYPRGIAYDAAQDAVHVACAGGELVTLPARGGRAIRTVHLDLDLRDVVIDGDHLLVSRFRDAELLVVDPSGAVSSRFFPDRLEERDRQGALLAFTPAVAWRTVAAPGGGALMVFQYEQASPIGESAHAYRPATQCDGAVVRTSAALLRRSGSAWTARQLPAILPIDVAVDPSTWRVAVASAAFDPVSSIALNADGQPVAHPEAIVFAAPSTAVVDFCRTPQPTTPESTSPSGRVVSVGFDWRGKLVVQTREPSSVVVGERAVILPGDNRKDTGHELFHAASRSATACASCHAEGRDDGHVWLSTSGPRRTKSIGGSIAGTAPYLWDGSARDFTDVVAQVWNLRLADELQPAFVSAVGAWIDTVAPPAPVPPSDAAASERGQRLFQDAVVGCASCHTGPKLTSGASADVGTRAAADRVAQFDVPSLLGVRWRPPFLHAGCAPTLQAWFDPRCGGGDQHGHTSQLTDGERADLIAYIETL